MIFVMSGGNRLHSSRMILEQLGGFRRIYSSYLMLIIYALL